MDLKYLLVFFLLFNFGFFFLHVEARYEQKIIKDNSKYYLLDKFGFLEGGNISLNAKTQVNISLNDPFNFICI